MRFKIDENLPVELASLLTRAGHHATTVVAEQLQGKADSTIVGVCVREKRVLVTLGTGLDSTLRRPLTFVAALFDFQNRQTATLRRSLRRDSTAQRRVH